MRSTMLISPVMRDLFGSAPFDAFFDRSPFRGWSPGLDLAETDEAVIVRLDVPGMSREDITIEAEGDRLTISGERRLPSSDREVLVHAGRGQGAFSRQIQLPIGAQLDEALASVQDGVLELVVPKTPEIRPRRIEIQAGQPELAAG